MKKRLKTEKPTLRSIPTVSVPVKKKHKGGKPFQSQLEPYFDEIWALRKARKTWAEVTEELRRKHGVTCTTAAVFAFFKKKKTKRYALGQDPNETLQSVAEPHLAPKPKPPRVEGATSEVHARKDAQVKPEPENPEWDLGYDPEQDL